ncbi:MAG TPA: hypothetical protein VFV72_13425 [Candidatus Limnocylindrales bacterium]|nr:hypothetical protein [Candidatus Limnocylindrales bacterium]
MSDRHPDLEIVEVATTRIGPAQRRPGDGGFRRYRAVIVVLVVALIVPVIAFVGPHAEQRLDFSYLVPTPVPTPDPSASPSRTPRPTPTPPPPTPSPPPLLTLGDGPIPPAIPVDVGGIRLVDPGTGDLGPASSIRRTEDAVFRGPNGGWSCICFLRTGDEHSERLEIVVRYIDSRAVERSAASITTIESGADPPVQDFGTHFDVAISPDGNVGFVAVAARRGDSWAMSVETIDVHHGTSIGHVDVASVDVPPSTEQEINDGYGTYLSGPFLRVSPGGDRLLMYYWLDRNTPTISERLSTSVSLIDLAAARRGGKAVGAGTALGGAIIATIPMCGYLQWLTEESIVGMCWREQPGAGESPVEVTSFGLDGSRVDGFDYTPDPVNWFADPVLDAANHRLFVWSPIGHQLDVLDLDGGHVRSIAVKPDGSTDVSGEYVPNVAQWPSWAAMFSDYTPWSTPALLGDPSGTRLFAVGMKEGPIAYNRDQYLGSTGIWTFDTTTLELADHWPAAGPYVGLGVSRDNRWIYALGNGGSNADGVASGWPPTISVHDATDGRLALQLAGFSRDESLLLVP